MQRWSVTERCSAGRRFSKEGRRECSISLSLVGLREPGSHIVGDRAEAVRAQMEPYIALPTTAQMAVCTQYGTGTRHTRIPPAPEHSAIRVHSGNFTPRPCRSTTGGDHRARAPQRLAARDSSNGGARSCARTRNSPARRSASHVGRNSVLGVQTDETSSWHTSAWHWPARVVVSAATLYSLDVHPL
eukprot:COSAG02_NODE_1257_length_13569_cov_5.370676_8_plen_187_part_00